MKKLYLIRHAKSSWSDPSLSDFDRPLNKRGKRDAPIMAAWLKDHVVQIGHIISSPAKRAKRTAKVFAETFDIEITYHESLYHADTAEIYSSIYAINDDHSSIAMFGHNPGFIYFANEFVGNSFIDNVPTCGIVGLTSSIDSWADFSPDVAKLEFFMYPKKLNVIE